MSRRSVCPPFVSVLVGLLMLCTGAVLTLVTAPGSGAQEVDCEQVTYNDRVITRCTTASGGSGGSGDGRPAPTPEPEPDGQDADTDSDGDEGAGPSSGPDDAVDDDVDDAVPTRAELDQDERDARGARTGGDVGDVDADDTEPSASDDGSAAADVDDGSPSSNDDDGSPSTGSDATEDAVDNVSEAGDTGGIDDARSDGSLVRIEEQGPPDPLPFILGAAAMVASGAVILARARRVARKPFVTEHSDASE